MKEIVVPGCMALGQLTLQHEKMLRFIGTLVFVSPLIKSKPLSPALVTFVIISSLSSACTAGFSLHLICSLNTDVWSAAG